MKTQNQWLFESNFDLRSNAQEYNLERNFSESPPTGGQANQTASSSWAKKAAPVLVPIIQTISGLGSAGEQVKDKAKAPIEAPQPPPIPPAKHGTALKAASGIKDERKKNNPEQHKKTPPKSGPPNPSSFKMTAPSFTGYSIPPVMPQSPAVNNAGFRTREAEYYFGQELENHQSRWLFEVPPSEADYNQKRGQGHGCTKAKSILSSGQMDELRRLARKKAEKNAHAPKGGGKSNKDDHEKAISRSAVSILNKACRAAVTQGYDAARKSLL
jgi:hypothetical protein